MDSFFGLLIIIAVIAFTVYVKWYNSPAQKGKRGELRIYEILSQNKIITKVSSSLFVQHIFIEQKPILFYIP